MNDKKRKHPPKAEGEGPYEERTEEKGNHQQTKEKRSGRKKHKKAKRMNNSNPEPKHNGGSKNAFRETEKRFKRYKSVVGPVDLSSVVDFYAVYKNSTAHQQNIIFHPTRFHLPSSLSSSSCSSSSSSSHSSPSPSSSSLHLHKTNTTNEQQDQEEDVRGKIYSLQDVPGFFFVCNPFPAMDHLLWSERCLRHYAQPPNVSNLDQHYGPCYDLFDLYFDSSRRSSSSPSLSPTSLSSLSPLSPSRAAASSSPPSSSSSSSSPDAKMLLTKLRWATLGYHYDWTKRCYVKEHKGEFPSELAGLCSALAEAVGQKLIAEAAIVNFYALDTVLCGHRDDAEFYFDAPIVSISFGKPAIFLLGGAQKEHPPIPILVRSGDVVIMGGSSRLAYHGVPRILEYEPLPTELLALDLSNKEEENNNYKNTKEEAEVGQEQQVLPLVRQYLQNYRININVRQVLPPNTPFPDPPSDAPIATTK